MIAGWKRRLASMVIIVACLAGGALECNRPALSPAELRGQELYGRMCAVCHGSRGQGYAADNATALAHPEFLGTAEDRLLRAAIAFGRTKTTMSAWSTQRGGPLSPEDVDAVIAFIRTWQPEAIRDVDERPLRGDAKRGQQIYDRACAACHGVRGQGGKNVAIGNPELLARVSNGFLRHAVRVGRPGTPMPAYGQALGDEGVEDVVALLRSWQRPVRTERPHPAKPPPIPLGPVPLNPNGPEPRGFQKFPKRTSIDVIKPELDRGARMALLDARAPSAYTNEHIPGAVSVPFYDPKPYFDELPKDAWLIAYCACPHAESIKLASALVDAGFEKVTVLDEGLREWRLRQYPTHKGAKP